MTTINRLNTTISDHNMAANFVALFLLVCVSAISAVAITHSGNLAKSSYDTLMQSIQATQVPITETLASKAQTTQQASTSVLSTGNGSPLSMQNQPKNIVAQLQPAQSVQLTANNLQPAVNSIQLTGTNLQNAESIL